jgi:hypothetical protein
MSKSPPPLISQAREDRDVRHDAVIQEGVKLAARMANRCNLENPNHFAQNEGSAAIGVRNHEEIEALERDADADLNLDEIVLKVVERITRCRCHSEEPESEKRDDESAKYVPQKLHGDLP